MPLNEHPIHFDVDGQRCHGMLHLPLGATAPVPAVLMLHGFTGQRMEPHRLFVLFSRLLAEHGMASLRFDFRGSGESEGSFDQMTVSRELEDVSAAYTFLGQRPEIDPQRLGLLGLSMGGMMAALSAPRHRFAALGLWAPAHPKAWLRELHGKPLDDATLRAAFDWPPPDPAALLKEHRGKPLDEAITQAIFQQALQVAHRPLVGLRPEGLDWVGNPVSFEFFHDLNRYEPLQTVSAYTGPALVVHGTADPAVPLSIGQAYARALEGRGPTEFHPIENALHTFEVMPHQQEAHRVTLEFFARYL
jgi:hypothetical protein